jgi:hypothetical protein
MQVKVAIENIREIIEEIIPEYVSVIQHYEAIPILIMGIQDHMPEPHKSKILHAWDQARKRKEANEH